MPENIRSVTHSRSTRSTQRERRCTVSRHRVQQLRQGDRQVSNLAIRQDRSLEYRLRPYRHFIKFENVSFEPGRKTEPKFRSSRSRRQPRQHPFWSCVSPTTLRGRAHWSPGTSVSSRPTPKRGTPRSARTDRSTSRLCLRASTVDLAVPLVRDPHRDSASADSSPATATGDAAEETQLQQLLRQSERATGRARSRVHSV